MSIKTLGKHLEEKIASAQQKEKRAQTAGPGDPAGLLGQSTNIGDVLKSIGQQGVSAGKAGLGALGKGVKGLVGGAGDQYSVGLGDALPESDVATGALTAGAGGAGALGAGMLAKKILGKAPAAAAAAPAAAAAAPGIGSLLRKLITKRAQAEMSEEEKKKKEEEKKKAEGDSSEKCSHLDALDVAANHRAIEMMKIAQDLEASGQELTFDDVMGLTNPDNENFLEGLVTELAMAKLDQNGLTADATQPTE